MRGGSECSDKSRKHPPPELCAVLTARTRLEGDKRKNRRRSDSRRPLKGGGDFLDHHGHEGVQARDPILCMVSRPNSVNLHIEIAETGRHDSRENDIHTQKP
jgi:hypothetical protein